MIVKHVSITKPDISGINSAEDLIAYCARVSNPTNQLNVETAPRLLKYCIKHGHWSIFEMVDWCVEITTSRAIAAQILRHKSFSFQEFSQRYSTALGVEKFQWREQGKTNRQVGDKNIELDRELEERVNKHVGATFALYEELLDQGIAKECARMVLPLNTSTTLYMKGSVRSWLSYFNVRLCPDTQKEHRDIALATAHMFKIYFPNVTEACENFNNFEGKFM